MYQHPTLINPIRIYITDIVYLSKLENRVNFKIIFLINLSQVIYLSNILFNKYHQHLEIHWDAEKTLINFCIWQNKYRKVRNINTQVDMAILITK